MKINLPKMGVYYILAMLFLSLAYSYRNASWVLSVYGAAYKYANTSSFLYISIIYSVLIVTILLSFAQIRALKVSCIFALVLLATVGFYFVRSILEDGVYSALTNVTSPIGYLFVLAIYIGMQDYLWKAVKKIIPWIIGCLCLLLCYEYSMLFIDYGTVIIGNSSVMFYFVNLFWCITIYLTSNVVDGNKLSWKSSFLLIILIVMSVIINSRSWVIQSCFITVSLYLLAPSKRNLIEKMRSILIIAVLMWVGWKIINTYFSNNLANLINKIGRDSRSHQYKDILNASTILGWIFGNGALATYMDTLQGEIRSIDNQFLYTAFHYGIILMVIWVIPQLGMCFAVRKVMSFIAVVPIVSWFMALGGLSVYNAIYCDLKQIIVMLYVGHIISICKKKRKTNNSIDDICRNLYYEA